MFGSLSQSSNRVLMVFALTAMVNSVNANYQSDHYRFLERDWCNSKQNCHECIQTPRCAWCSEPTFRSPRCFTPYSNNSRTLATCSEEFVQNPDNMLITIRQAELTEANSSRINGHSHDIDSSSYSFSNSSFGRFSTDRRQDNTVQLSPQEVKLKLRLHEPITISFSYAPSDDSHCLVEFRDTASANVEVKYFSSCLENGTVNETNKCNGLGVGSNVKFLAKIEATGCPTRASEWRQTFAIYPVGVNERLTVDLTMICDCDCEHPSNPFYQSQSRDCNGVGTLKCGICECNDGYFGRNCECNLSAPTIGSDDCRPDNTSLVDCSGRGTCICGRCSCEERSNPNERITGRYCECDNFSCDRDLGLLCSDHGSCQCGRCVCDRYWAGPACNCFASIAPCIAPEDTSDVPCSGHGDCICGYCVCHSNVNGRSYFGRYCNETVGDL